MARTLNSKTDNAAHAREVAGIAHLFEAKLDATALRLTNAERNIVFNSDPSLNSNQDAVFTSVGSLGSVSAVEEGAELQAYSIDLTLAGINKELLAIALQQHYQGRSAKLWLALLGENSKILGEPILLFAGRIDAMRWSAGENAQIILNIQNPLADWERAKLSRYTHSEQQKLYPNDEFFEFINHLAEKPVFWGG